MSSNGAHLSRPAGRRRKHTSGRLPALLVSRKRWDVARCKRRVRNEILRLKEGIGARATVEEDWGEGHSRFPLTVVAPASWTGEAGGAALAGILPGHAVGRVVAAAAAAAAAACAAATTPIALGIVNGLDGRAVA